MVAVGSGSCYQRRVQPEQGQQRWDNMFTNLRGEQELLRVLDILEGLYVVVFKGGILTRMIYGDLGARASVDNDLWVRSSETRAALDRLLGAGFSPLPGLDPVKALTREGQVALWADGKDAVGADLHASPFSRKIFSVPENVLEEHVVEFELHGRSIHTFDRPLAFAHLVAHYVQHRLEPSHLRDIGAAWDSWKLDESGIRRIARQTCTEAALEFALGAARDQGYCTRAVIEPSHQRARSLLHWTDRGRRLGGETSGRFLSLALAAPRRIPSWAYRGILLEDDEFVARSGRGRSLMQVLRRIRDLARRG